MARQSNDKSPLPVLREYNAISALVEEGKVFHVSNVAVGTEIVGQTSYVATATTFSLRNLGAKLMVPLWARLVQADAVAGGRIIVHTQVLETDQFTSGTALPIMNSNWRNRDASGALAFHTATLPTFTTGNARLVQTGEYFQTVSAANNDNIINAFTAPGFVGVRPNGALHIYTWAGTTGPSWSFDIGWAEVEY